MLARSEDNLRATDSLARLASYDDFHVPQFVLAEQYNVGDDFDEIELPPRGARAGHPTVDLGYLKAGDGSLPSAAPDGARKVVLVARFSNGRALAGPGTRNIEQVTALALPYTNEGIAKASLFETIDGELVPVRRVLDWREILVHDRFLDRLSNGSRARDTSLKVIYRRAVRELLSYNINDAYAVDILEQALGSRAEAQAYGRKQ